MHDTPRRVYAKRRKCRQRTKGKLALTTSDGQNPTHTESPVDESWRQFARDLARCLVSLSEDEFLVISSKRKHYYIQFAAQGQFGMRAEAMSNNYAEPEHRLSADAERAMVQVGWKAPNPDPVCGSPNFFTDCEPDRADFEKLAALAVATFRRVYGTGHPGYLQYYAYSHSAKIKFPTLRIKNEV
jgi:hypothetical protein